MFWESLRLAKFRDKLGILFSALLVVSCVYTFVWSPKIMCIVDKCSNITYHVLIVFPRTVATVCIITTITFTCKSTSDKFADYEERIKRYGHGFPNGVREQHYRHVYTASFAAVCASVLIPSNAYRLYLFYEQHGNLEVIVYFLLMYSQNAIGCLSEIRFLPYCIELYQHFRLINEEISAIKSTSIVINRYPSVLESDGYRRRAGNNVVGTAASGDGRGVPLPHRRVKQCAVAKTVETLKARHQFVSDMFRELNELYGIQLGVNLFGLFVMTLFDIFEAIAIEDSGHPTKDMFLIYSWLTQYSLRFCVIVLTAHVTTSQALHSKTLITDINHRYMDTNTKEEVRLFLNELCTRSMQFTTLDFFNLNARLITSAIVAGTTYIVVLLQFRGR